jgi:hypothetical protein
LAIRVEQRNDLLKIGQRSSPHEYILLFHWD